MKEQRAEVFSSLSTATTDESRLAFTGPQQDASNFPSRKIVPPPWMGADICKAFVARSFLAPKISQDFPTARRGSNRILKICLCLNCQTTIIVISFAILADLALFNEHRPSLKRIPKSSRPSHCHGHFTFCPHQRFAH